MNTLLQQQQLYQEAKIREEVQKEIKAQEKGKVTSCWFNPCKEPVRTEHGWLEPQTIYLGEKNRETPTYEEPVYSVPKRMEGLKQYRMGKKAEAVRYDPWIGPWQNVYNEYLSRVEYKTAGAITASDFAAINVVNVMAELIGTQYLEHALQNAVTTVNTPGLILQVDTYTKFTAWQDVDEGITTPTKKGALSRQQLTLLKDVGHIAMTDEAQLKPLEHNFFQVSVQNAVQDLKRIKARKIATEMQTATSIAAGDWAGITGSFSSRNPLDDIGSASDVIFANTGFPSVVASADRAYRDYASNTFIKGTTTPAPNQNYGARVLNGVNNYTWVIENEMTNTLAVVLDPRAIVLGQGPIRTSNYREERAGLDGYIIRDFNAVKTVNTGWIRQLTGVSA